MVFMVVWVVLIVSLAFMSIVSPLFNVVRSSHAVHPGVQDQTQVQRQVQDVDW